MERPPIARKINPEVQERSTPRLADPCLPAPIVHGASLFVLTNGNLLWIRNPSGHPAQGRAAKSLTIAQLHSTEMLQPGCEYATATGSAWIAWLRSCPGQAHIRQHTQGNHGGTWDVRAAETERGLEERVAPLRTWTMLLNQLRNQLWERQLKKHLTRPMKLLPFPQVRSGTRARPYKPGHPVENYKNSLHRWFRTQYPQTPWHF